MIYLQLDTTRSTRNSSKWIFLSRNYEELMKLKASHQSTYVNISGIIADITERVREEYLIWHDDLIMNNRNSDVFWFNHVTSKNYFLCNLFLHLIYVNVVISLVGKKYFESDDSFTIYCENDALLLTIRAVLEKAGLRCQTGIFEKCRLILRKISLLAKIPFYFLGHSCLYLKHYIAARKSKKEYQGQKAVFHDYLINICLSNAALEGSGSARDMYLAPFIDWLRENGINFAVMPWLFNAKSGLNQKYLKIRQSYSNVLVVEDYVNPWQIIGALFLVIKSAFFRGGRHISFDGNKYDIGQLLKNEKLLAIRNFTVARFFLQSKALKMWKKKGGGCAVYLDVFENIPADKGPLLFFKKSENKPKCLGYTHAMPSPNMLNYHVTENEARWGFLPDIVITNGNLLTNALIRQGVPQSNICTGPFLKKQIVGGVKNTDEVKNIFLVLLSADFGISLELIEAVSEIQDYIIGRGMKILVRKHPLVRYEKLIELVPKASRFELDILPLEKSAGNASMAIGIDSSVQLECMIMGCPVINLGRQTDVSLNPFAYWTDKYQILNSVNFDSLCERIAFIIENRGEYGKIVEDIAGSFNPSNEQYLKTFLV